jgi:hypothetical protein
VAHQRPLCGRRMERGGSCELRRRRRAAPAIAASSPVNAEVELAQVWVLELQ